MPEKLTRRDLLKLGAAAGLGVVGLGACQAPGAPATPAATAKPGATTAAATTTAPAATAAPAATKPATSGAKDEVVIARPEEIQQMDAANNFNLVNYDLFLHIMDCLVDMDEKGNIVPSLAESWDVSPDGLAWTFKLKKGVKFHDGDTFTSKAVKMNIERLKDTKLARATWWGPLDRVDTPDDYTAIIRTKTPLGTMLTNLLTPLGFYSPKSMEANPTNFFDKPIGTGPYRFVEWRKNERFVMEANPDYYKGAPKIKRIVYRPINEDQTRVSALRTGEIDIVDTVPPDQVKLLQSDPNLTIRRDLAWDQLFLGLKCDQPPFDKKEARQAVNYAIDRQAIIDKILEGGKPAVGFVPDPMMGYASELKPYPYDPEKAKSLLKTAGWTGGKLKFIAPQGWYPKLTEVTDAISAYLKAVGLDNEVTVMEGAAFTQARVAGTYNIYVTGGASRDPNDLSLQRIRLDVHKSGYKNDQVFKLIDEANATVDQKKRAQMYIDAQKILYDEGPQVWLYQMEAIYGLKKGIQGFRTYPFKVWDLRTASWG